MTDLSPAAQAILKAAYEATRNPNWQTNFYTSYAAATLRAAADQVVPTTVDPRLGTVRSDLMRIAAELEAQ